MQHIFDDIINSFIEKKVGIANHFLHKELANGLKENLLLHFKNQTMHQAGIGNNKGASQNNLFRNDKIFWLDKLNNNEFENAFFDLMEQFILYLNSTCFTSITSYEFHYTLYEEGCFYKKHIDQFANNSSRKFSMIMYLNDDWKIADGGELCIYHQEGLQFISPNNGKSIFFRSNELAHEVLLTNKIRMSITGWLKTN